MKKKQLLAAVLAAASLTWASSGAPADAYPMLFPNTGYSYVGDTMPFYDGKEFRIFYLEDIRNEPIIDGFHPWSLFTTPDFLDYRHNSRIIPFPKKEYAKDFALGTGSVTQGKNGLYHAFYTGFNWRTHPKENIMHATSSDMVHWQKIPEDTFKGDAMYLHDDFRDPNVFYNKDYGEYWMTITTRMSKGNKPRGVIALYTSQDLKTWANQGVLYAYDEKSDCNLEAWRRTPRARSNSRQDQTRLMRRTSTRASSSRRRATSTSRAGHRRSSMRTTRAVRSGLATWSRTS